MTNKLIIYKEDKAAGLLNDDEVTGFLQENAGQVPLAFLYRLLTE